MRRCRPFHKYIRYGYIRSGRAASVNREVRQQRTGSSVRCRIMGRMPRTLAVLFAVPLLYAADPAPREWPVYGGGPESIRHSTLKQINRANVKQLDDGVVLRRAGWAGRIADQPDHRRRRAVRQHAEEPRDRAGRGQRETALEVRFRARPARGQSRRHVLGGGRRPADLRRGGQLRLRAGRAHRQGDRELRKRRPHRSARRTWGATRHSNRWCSPRRESSTRTC